METVTVIAKSKKAKNRLANMMNRDPICIVEQHKDNRIFLRSANGAYFFWVNLTNDLNWSIVM